ncbi:hypothetical protein NEMIN01_0648 [Nematocida minor]|uniref:uncharacterized protein n=1 Tax=Nematocida minor TaxID=1912983 RepID=UPI00221F5375|nr:uncharacterized protein NEMIN01_0648 [Nematocida minor]KAI5189695.1 hypothetical protein NEMIN01_0648 [Nematocida minor]
MKKELSPLGEMYEGIAQEIAVYCQAARQQQSVRPLPEQEYLEKVKQMAVHHIKHMLFKIKTGCTQEKKKRQSEHLMLYSTGCKMYDIFKWLRPRHTYLQFLRGLKKNKREIFTADYEEIEVKRKVSKYFREFTPYVPPHKIVNKHRYTELESRSYCIPCRRVIANKMAARHNSSKAHEKDKPVYLRITEAQAHQIDQEFISHIKRNKLHLNNLIQRQLKVKPKNITLSVYPHQKITWKEKTGRVDIKYECRVCDRTYTNETLFMSHFAQREHKGKLRSLGIKNSSDYIGLTTKEDVQKRKNLYFDRAE